MLNCNTAFGQYEYAKDGVAARATFLNYQWPALKSDFVGSDFTSGLEIEYLRHLSKVLNISFPLKLAKANLPTNEDGGFKSSGIASLDALLHLKLFREPNFIYPYIFGGVGVVGEEFERFNVAAPVGLSINFRLARHVYLSAKGEYRFGFADLRDNAQLAAGLLVLLGPGAPEPITDRDFDGVPDDQDLCPDVAGLATFNGCPDTDGDGITDGEDLCPTIAGLEAFNGCPDSDGDGIPDKDDGCPNEAGPASNNGCPIRDADRDGIPDVDDLCPNEPGLAALNGCPDRDGDGIADRDDACPNEAGPRSTNGCPDTDGDGIIDSRDRCPTTPGIAANNGCPEIKEEDRAVLSNAMRMVEFETGKATLRPDSRRILDQIVDILNRYPDYNLRISGHTDSQGSESFNQKLSEDRARSCFDYLVSKGISSSRLSSAGYGELRPIADNRTAAGRELNRRVEFELHLD